MTNEPRAETLMLEGKVWGSESRSLHVIRPVCFENYVKAIKYRAIKNRIMWDIVLRVNAFE